MDRAERTGLGVALIGHLLLFGALSVSLLRPTPKLASVNPPINVDLIDAKALETAAPDAVKDASAPPAPNEVASDALTMTPPQPLAATVPPKPVSDAGRPSEKPTPAKEAKRPAKPTDAAAAKSGEKARQSKLDSGLGAQLSRAASRETTSPGTGRGSAAQGSGTPAARTAAQLEASFIQALFSRIKRYWRAPTGVDAELLKTNIVVTLKPDGSIGTITVTSQTGETENNSNLKALHQERAVSAIRRAAPFDLPPEHYAIWQSLGPITFDKRLN